jgi:hypothetical protein
VNQHDTDCDSCSVPPSRYNTPGRPSQSNLDNTYRTLTQWGSEAVVVNHLCLKGNDVLYPSSKVRLNRPSHGVSPLWSCGVRCSPDRMWAMLSAVSRQDGYNAHMTFEREKKPACMICRKKISHFISIWILRTILCRGQGSEQCGKKKIFDLLCRQTTCNGTLNLQSVPIPS